MDDDKLDLIIKLCEADVSMKSRELVTDIMKSLTTSEVSQIRDMVKRKVADRIADDMRSYNYSGHLQSTPNFKDQLNTAVQTEIKAAVDAQKPIIEKAIKDLLPSYLGEANIKAVISRWAASLK
jgi:flagellar biosynthesis/type III secretory pathway M-ring protein FliF/YscJ